MTLLITGSLGVALGSLCVGKYLINKRSERIYFEELKRDRAEREIKIKANALEIANALESAATIEDKPEELAADFAQAIDKPRLVLTLKYEQKDWRTTVTQTALVSPRTLPEVIEFADRRARYGDTGFYYVLEGEIASSTIRITGAEALSVLKEAIRKKVFHKPFFEFQPTDWVSITLEKV